MEQLDESQKTQKILFITASKKMTKLQKPKHKRLLNESSNPYSSVEVTFIVSRAPEANLKTEPNSVTKMGINPESSLQILTTLRWHIRHDLYIKQEIWNNVHA